VVTRVFEFSGLKSGETVTGEAGNIVGISGFEEVAIGETLCDSEEREPVPFVELDPPTIQMQFAVNDGPLAGRDGKFVTARHIRERLQKEIRTNISLHLEDTDAPNIFLVSARGEMQIAILVEQMRREGYEVLVSRPEVILKRGSAGLRRDEVASATQAGVSPVNSSMTGGRDARPTSEGDTLLEPIETLWIEVPNECLGDILQNLAARKAEITNMNHHGHGVTVKAVIPMRGLIGFETDLVNQTSGRAAMSHLFKGYEPWRGEIVTRRTGTLVSMENGFATAWALNNIQERGRLFIGAGEEVYEGMIIGENPRAEDMPVNPAKTKHLTNIRSQGEGKGIQLEPPLKMSLERSLEYIAPDEYVEATPKNLRLRKKILNATQRKRAALAASSQLSAVS
jgi:GTP-binding protein